MRNLPKVLILSLAFSLPLVGCTALDSTKQTSETMIERDAKAMQDVASVLEGYSGAIVGKDLALMETYVLADATDFTIFEGKGANLGWADYRDNHLAPEFAGDDLIITRYAYTDFETRVSGNLATVTFAIDVAVNHHGEATERTQRGTAILKNIDGVWKIAHLHTS